MELFEEVSNATISANLYGLDVPYLRTEGQKKSVELSSQQLIYELICNDEPRIQEAVIPLFLRHPDYEIYVLEILNVLPADKQRKLKHFYTVAVYLQRLWRTRLTDLIGETALLTDLFGELEFGLINPESHFGEAGLRQLAQVFSEESGFEILSSYHSIMETFLINLTLFANE